MRYFSLVFLVIFLLAFPISIFAANKTQVCIKILWLTHCYTKINPRPTPTPRPTATPRPTKIPKPTKIPSVTPTVIPASTPSSTPTNTPIPTSTPTPTPDDITILFSDNKQAPAVDTKQLPAGYHSMTLYAQSQSEIIGLGSSASFDGGQTYLEQQRYPCGTSCNFTIPLISDFYQVGTGGNTGLVTIWGVLHYEPNGHVFHYGPFNYPYTSPTFNTTGFSTIYLTVGPGDNPQHLTGVSLQREENGVFVEKEAISCDGGARCDLQSLPVLGGNYRIIINGNGVNGIIGGILRP